MEPRRDIAERTFAFAVEIVKFARRLTRVNRPIANQVLRSGTSVGANVEEAQAAQSRKDFVHKNQIALKEARETRYWLRLAIATDLVPPEIGRPLLTESCELCNILGAIVVRAKQSMSASEPHAVKPKPKPKPK